MTLMTSRPGVLLDAPPRVRSVPSGGHGSSGAEAIELAEQAGLVLDPWQRFVLEDALAERPGGRWLASEVGLVVARQNGKGSVLEARELFGLFLAHEELIVHSAHEFKTAAEAFRRVLELVEQTPALSARVAKIMRANGEEGIELKPRPTVITGADGSHTTRGVRSRLRFFARTGGSGRGFSADTIILDEAYNLPERALDALMPTMATKHNPQIWYTSSAVDQQNPSHQNGHVLARVRRRGLKGGDRSLVYLEWSVDEDVFYADPERVAADPASWAQANPGLGIRLPVDNVAREHKAMDPRSFATERLSVGDWPTALSDASGPIPLESWAALTDEQSLGDAAERAAAQMVFGVSVTPRRDAASVAVAARRPDGLFHVEVVSSGPGVDWVLGRLAELYGRRYAPVALAAGSPSASLMAGLAERGVEVEALSAQQVGQACGAFFDAVMDAKNLRHLGQPELAAALKAARTKQSGDRAWSWSLRDSPGDITPLVASTLALHLLMSSPGPAPNLW